MNYIPNDIDAGTLFIEGNRDISQEGWGGGWIDGGSAFIGDGGSNGIRSEGIRD